MCVMNELFTEEEVIAEIARRSEENKRPKQEFDTMEEARDALAERMANTNDRFMFLEKGATCLFATALLDKAVEEENPDIVELTKKLNEFLTIHNRAEYMFAKYQLEAIKASQYPSRMAYLRGIVENDEAYKIVRGKI